jgi:hypothetical protein
LLNDLPANLQSPPRSNSLANYYLAENNWLCFAISRLKAFGVKRIFCDRYFCLMLGVSWAKRWWPIGEWHAAVAKAG